MRRRLAYVVERVGPYHRARFAAFAARVGNEEMVVVEVAGGSLRHPWAEGADTTPFGVYKLFAGEDYFRLGSRELKGRLKRVLGAIAPDCLAVNGWGFVESRAGMAWARSHGCGVVLLSDSQERDARRFAVKEWLKKRLVCRCDSAFVAGPRQAAYVEKLGMPAARIVEGYDVVDNHYFASRVNRIRAESDRLREENGLPKRYWLCCARLVHGKGLYDLLHAYARYRDRAGSGAWELVFAGDGPLRGPLLDLASKLRVDRAIRILGFVQYDELPTVYGLASGLVLASWSETWGLVVNEAMAAGLPVLVSRACGCQPELVEEGVNGYSFEPGDVGALTMLLERVATSPELEAMGEASRRRIVRWTPETWAEALDRAVSIALEHSRGR